MPRAVILGGTGFIGRAVARRLLDEGWSVALAGRGTHPVPPDLLARGAAALAVDRDEPGALGRAMGGGADLLVDVVAYGAEHGRQLLDLQGDIGALHVVSSASVYRDAAGRTLDTAAAGGFPLLPVPVGEAQPTIAPGPASYSSRKVALERVLLDGAAVPLTLIRPGTVSGPGAKNPREWWAIKRVLDQRPVIPLAYGGRSRFHTTSVDNIAALVSAAAARPGTRVLNVADPVAPTVGDIVEGVGRHLGYRGRVLRLPDEGRYPATLGRTPWSVPHDVVLDTGAAAAIGYAPRTTFADALPELCDAIVAAAAACDWRDAFPGMAASAWDPFDYAAEDAAFPAAGPA